MQRFIEFGSENIRNIKFRARYEWYFKMKKIQNTNFGNIINHLLTSDDAYSYEY